MNKRLSPASALALLLAAGLLFASIFLPWWGMTFNAPQYPEGLDIIVYPHKLDGRIDIINGLNHYIGMKEFSEESFPELTYLPWLIGIMGVLVLLAALLRKKGLLLGLVALFVIGGALGLYDINRWLTSFGTELSPTAPIDIEPFVPPVVGENRIANFVTRSYFSTGAYLAGAAFLLILFPLWRDRK